MAKQPEVIGEAFNFSSGQPLSVLDITHRILERMDSALEPEIQSEATHEIPHQYLCAEKARSMLAWEPKYSLDDALDETIAWYRRYLGITTEAQRHRESTEKTEIGTGVLLRSL
jgi:CDP-glucose 4,6-dehydratase